MAVFINISAKELINGWDGVFGTPPRRRLRALINLQPMNHLNAKIHSQVMVGKHALRPPFIGDEENTAAK